MRLLDSLLLDPHKLDVWIALRTDGVKGSGTESDPYDASPRKESALSITSITYAGREATVTTTSAHPYNDGNVVMIEGVTGAGAGQFNGRFSIYGKTSTTFKYAMNAVPGGTASGTISCARIVFQFDELMYPGFAEYTAIHLGPGVFETRGFSQAIGGWFARSGWKFIGSGIDVTTLKIVHGHGAEIGTVAQHLAIGTYIHANIDDFEASDFTVDCNLGGQPVLPDDRYFSPVLCGAIRVGGNHSRIRRIRAINWGSQSTVYECFVLSVGGSGPTVGEVVDCVIEDCILERPALNNAQLVSCIIMTGAIERGAFHRGCAVRNCTVNGEYTDRPVPISQITFTGTTATVTTPAPHGRAVDDWVRIAGALVNGSADNPFNGSFEITSATSTTFQYTMTSTPSAAPVGEMWVGRFSSHPVSVSSLVKTGAGPYTVTIVTSTPHFRVPGNNILLDSQVPSYKGSFNVKEVVDRVTLRYEVATDPGSPPNPTTTPATIGVQYHALGVGAGTGAVLEGCRVYHTGFATYGDSYSTRDMVIRNNFFHDVYRGCYFVMNLSGPLNAGSALARDGSTAIFTALQAHGLSIGNNVTVKNAVVNNSTNNVYNGTFTVQSVISSTKFSYPMTGVPSDLPNATSAPLYKLQSQSDTLRKPGAKLERDGSDPTIARFTALEAHGLSAGNSISVSGAVVADSTTNNFNGNFTVLDVPDSFTFKNQMSAAPATDAFSAPVFDAGAGEKVGTPLVHGTGAEDDLATFTSLIPHGLLPQQAVQVSGTLANGSANNPFNGYFEIESVPTSPNIGGKPTSFTYRMTSAPATNASPNPLVPMGYQEVWQTRHTVIENNVIELTPGLPSQHSPAIGIYCVDLLHLTTLPRFVELIVRGNVIRELNATTDGNSWGIVLDNCRNGIVEDNVIDPKVGNFLYQDKSSDIEYFNNQTPSGLLLQALDGPANRKIDELTTLVEDAAVLAF